MRPLLPGRGEWGRGLGKAEGWGRGAQGTRRKRDLAFSPQIKNMWAAFPPDVTGMVDYKNICYVITHGDAKDQE